MYHLSINLAKAAAVSWAQDRLTAILSPPQSREVFSSLVT